MDNPIEHFWNLRLQNAKKALEANNFEVHLAATAQEAKDLALETILPAVKPASISWGGSVTLVKTGIYHALRDRRDIDVLDSNNPALSASDKVEMRRQALLADLYITGTNAVTETGKLVNLDMTGNRVAALTFGPRHVLVLAGRNKLVADLEEAMFRVKDYAAPVNSMRLDKKTPCVKTGFCEDCKSPDRICNTWTITEKSYPKGRTKIVLINEEVGF